MLQISVQKKLHTSTGSVDLAIDFEIKDGDFICVYGPSGSGKSTLLRMIAGLTQPDEGNIRMGDESWYDSRANFHLSVQKRNVGFVFQDRALFNHMSVRENLEFALNGTRDREAVDQAIEIADLKSLQFVKTNRLSIGQQQRVAFFRTIIQRPRIFLFDEPFTAQDAVMRQKLQNELLKMFQRLKITTLFVTHDLSEVFRLSKKVFVINDGKIVKSGEPQEIFIDHQLSGKFRFVGEILGIKQDDAAFIVTILIGNQVTKVVATQREVKDLSVGSKVIVSAKAFNPMILTLQSERDMR